MGSGQFRILTLESLRDAFRRRVVTAVIIVTLCSLWVMDGCTACVPSDFVVNGQNIEELGVVGGIGMAIFGVIAIWSVILAGLLASDHLSSTLEDGSAVLVLSKSVSRVTFVLARLAGSLSVSLTTSALLLACAALFLWFRHGLALPPAALGGIMTLGSCLVVAALAMLCSLYFNRITTFLFVLFVVGSVTATNVMMLFGAQPSGFFGILNNFGPPFATAIGVALAPWGDTAVPGGAAFAIYARLFAWMCIAVAALTFRFRRLEIST